MSLFKKAIVGNEQILADGLDVESGLWIGLQTQKVLTDRQLEICKTEVS